MPSISFLAEIGAKARSTVAAILAVGLLLLPASAAFAAVSLRSDFNGDGYDDLVVALPGYDVGNVPNAGAFIIVPGGPDGIEPSNATQLWHRGVDGIPGVQTRNEHWGLVLEAADFNTDGYFDLAIGSPSAMLDNVRDRGDVLILYGSSDGLRINNLQWIVPDPGLGAARFGAALASGAFNADPLTDLAVGAPGANDGEGAVLVYHAAFFAELALATELAPPPDIAGVAVREFGAALVAASFSAPSFGFGGDELVVSARHLREGSFTTGGIYRASPDLAAGGLVLASEPAVDLATFAGVAEGGSLYASTLAAADFDGDGIADLAIGVPTADVVTADEELAGAGVVLLMRGTVDGFVAAETPLLLQDMLGFRDEVEAGDRFGTALAIGDFDADGFADIAIGSPLEDDGPRSDRGVVHFAYGSPAGLDPIRRMTVHHDMNSFGPVIGASDGGNLFGAGVGVGDFNNDGFHDIAIGIPGKASPDGIAGDGWMIALHGGPRGVTTAYARAVSRAALVALEMDERPGNNLGLAVTGGDTNCSATLCSTVAE